MPYVNEGHRKILDPHIDDLIEAIKRAMSFKEKTEFAGLLNYCCSRLAMSFFYNGEREPVRYWKLALIDGVFHTLTTEIKRRVLAPYEDIMKDQNGDLREFDEFQGPYKKKGKMVKVREKGGKKK